MRFAYSTINWGTGCDLAQAAEEIAAAGWRAVELFGHSLDLLGMPSSTRRRLGGLSVATVFGHVDLPFDPGTQLEGHRRQIEFAAEVGAASYGVVGGQRLRQRAPSGDEYAALAELLEEMAVIGADHGISIGYHPHTGCTIETGSEIDRLLELSPRTRLCLDVSHVAVVGEDPLEQLGRYRDRLAYVHLKDWRDGHFTGLGDGILGPRWPDILSWLNGPAYDGLVVVEQSRSETSPSRSAEENAAFIQRLGYDIGGGH